MNKKINAILFYCFFLSGLAGLIYEVLWAKYLSLIFGHTTYAHTLVLSTFMAGLALGSLLLGRLSDRIENRLSLFAWIQIGIGFYCFFTPELFDFSKNIYIPLAKNSFLNPAGILIIKFIIGALIMLPPTVLMGGTLPILTRFMVKSLSTRGETVARLYYINSFGAVVGTLLAGFFLIYRLGFRLSITTAVFINLFVGLIALVVKMLYQKYILSQKYRQEEDTYEEKEESADTRNSPSRIIKISLAGIFLSGFVAMLYEVVWIRLLSTILGSSTYSFSLMLAAFISGITLGSFLISKFMPRTKDAFLYFGFCEILIGVSLIFSLPFYEKLPFLFLSLSKIFIRTPETFFLYATTKFFLSFLVMFLPTVFLGATIPIVSKIVTRKLRLLGGSIGGVFAFNTSGNILGALITGLVLIPLLGLKHTLELGIIINILLGLAVVFADKNFHSRYKISIAVICLFIFTGYKLIIPEWNKSSFMSQLFRQGAIMLDYANLSKNIKERNILFYKDGHDCTVAVSEKEGVISLSINGKIDASTGLDMATQILSSQIPLILKPQAKDVLVVGLGSGVTCGSALLHPIESLDLLEISSSVVEANKYFKDANYNALNDNRLHLYVEDAKTFLQRTDSKYDLIISEPSNPWMSGIASLFSTEYFNDCRARLNDDGLMVQWVQAYESSDEIFEIVLQTFAQVFKEVTVWNIGVYDILLIGSRHKLNIDLANSEHRLAFEPVKKDLARINIYDLFSLLNLQLASNESVRNLTNTGANLLNSDFFPIVEYMAPIALYLTGEVQGPIIELEERNVLTKESNLLIKYYLDDNKITSQNINNLYSYVKERSVFNGNLIRALAKKWHSEYPGDKESILAYSMYNTDSLDNGIAALEGLIFKDRELKYMDNYTSLLVKRYRLCASYLLPGIFYDTIDKLKACLDLADTNNKPKLYYLIGNLYTANKDYGEALGLYTKAEVLLFKQKKEARTHTEAADTETGGVNPSLLLNKISTTYLKLGNLKKAFDYAMKAYLFDKQNPLSQSIIRAIQLKNKLR